MTRRTLQGTIQRDAPEPLHAQLKTLIKEAIENGRLRPGDRLPTEQQLCREFGLSRTPVRQALQELVQDGLLVRIPGRGTFVAQRDVAPVKDGVVTLHVVTEPGWASPLQQAALLWNHTHPYRRLRIVIEEVPYPRLRAHLMDRVAQGTAPDISLLDSAWVAEFAELGYLVSPDDISPDWEARNAHNLLDTSLQANRYQNRLMAIPASVDISVLWYRRDWLTNEGKAPPRTWEELVSLGRHFRKPEISLRYGRDTHGLVFVAGQRGGETTTYQLLPLLWNAGSEIIAGGHVVLNNKATIRFLEYLRSLIYEHHITPPDVVRYKWDQAARLFARRQAVMAFGGLYEIQFMCQERGWSEKDFLHRVGIAPIPAGPAGQYGTLGGMSYAIYRQSRYPELALGVLEQTAHPSVTRLYWKETRHHTPWLNPQPTSRLAPFLAETAHLLRLGRPRPSIPEYTRVSEQFRWLVEEALREHADLNMLISRAADRIAAITRLPLL